MSRGKYSLKVGNAFEQVKKFESGSVQLVVTSPPYNVGKEYETRAPLYDYLSEYRTLARELFTTISPTGSVCWQVGNYVQKGQLYPLDILFYPIFIEAGFQLKNRVVWHFRHGLHANKRFSGRYETILWFSKSSEPTFNLDSVRIPSLYPGKIAFKGPRKGQPTGNPGGKNPSDFWHNVMLEEWEKAIWDFPNVKSNHPEKTAHPCQFPVELAERCILAFSNEGDLVLDPFLGVGSTAVAAVRHRRNFLGLDVEKSYVAEARSRVKLEIAGNLLTRKIGTPIAKPNGKVATFPNEWKVKRHLSN